PPAFTFCVSLASAPESPLYFAATSTNAGPTIFLSTPWQAAHPSFAIIASAALVSRGPADLAAGALGDAAATEGFSAAAAAAAPLALAAGAAGSLKLAPD